MKNALLVILAVTLLAGLSACAPRVAVKPIPTDTPPETVLSMIRQKEEGLAGLRAFVEITVRKPDEKPRSFEAVLYLARPDSIRLTGISFLGTTAFDAILAGDKYFFSQPTTGYTESGPRENFRDTLRAMGVEVDPVAVYSAIFSAPPDGFHRNFIERTPDGYSHYILTDEGGVLAPVVRADYDAGLNLIKKTFYGDNASPHMSAEVGEAVSVDGYSLPGYITVRNSDEVSGTVEVRVEKYLVNPEGIEKDFDLPSM